MTWFPVIGNSLAGGGGLPFMAAPPPSLALPIPPLPAAEMAGLPDVSFTLFLPSPLPQSQLCHVCLRQGFLN